MEASVCSVGGCVLSASWRQTGNMPPYCLQPAYKMRLPTPRCFHTPVFLANSAQPSHRGSDALQQAWKVQSWINVSLKKNSLWNVWLPYRNALDLFFCSFVHLDLMENNDVCSPRLKNCRCNMKWVPTETSNPSRATTKRFLCNQTVLVLVSSLVLQRGE